MRTRMRQRGFTLIEMSVVVTVLAILVGLFVQNAQSAVEEARAMACEKNRSLYEDMEKQFEHDHERGTIALQELVDEKYVNKTRCPRGGVLAWATNDPELPNFRQALVCSVHGPKARIRRWFDPSEDDGDGNFAFSDDFSGPGASGWTEARGRYWEATNGRYYGGRPGGRRGGDHRTFTGSDDWTDYEVNLKANLERGNGIGVFFRTSDAARPDGYVFQYQSGNRSGRYTMRTVNNGRYGGTFASATAPRSRDFHGKDHDIRIETKGNQFTAYVDGKKVLTGTNSRYASGGIGLRTWGRSHASFDDVTVTLR